MVEKKGAFLWTTRNTLVKGWVGFHEDSGIEIEVDLEAHPHLINKTFSITPNVLVIYEYKEGPFIVPGGY